MARLLTYCFTGLAIGIAGFVFLTYLGVIWAAVYGVAICLVNGVGGRGCP